MANSGNGNNGAVSGINDARGAYFYSQQNGDFKSYAEMTTPSNNGNGWYFGVSFDRQTGSILFENRTAVYDSFARGRIIDLYITGLFRCRPLQN